MSHFYLCYFLNGLKLCFKKYFKTIVLLRLLWLGMSTLEVVEWDES